MTALTYTLQDFVPQHSFTGPRIPVLKTLTPEEILSAVPGTQFEIDEQQDLKLVAMGVFQDQTTPIVLEGLSFNLKERANFGLQFIRCAEVTIRHCRFYGYNPDRFITHGATDSNVLFQDCPMVTLEGNEFGPNDGIGTDADVLNRCITIQGTPVGSTIYRITDNLFSSVNQGIVALGDVFGATPDQFYLEGNRFYDVQDNGLYLIRLGGATIRQNWFVKQEDEAIVLDGGQFLLEYNTFIDTKNRVLAVNGDHDGATTEAITFQYNTVGNTENSGYEGVLFYSRGQDKRDAQGQPVGWTYRVRTLQIRYNHYWHIQRSYHLFLLEEVDTFLFEYNRIEVPYSTGLGSAVLYFGNKQPITAGAVQHNQLHGDTFAR